MESSAYLCGEWAASCDMLAERLGVLRVDSPNTTLGGGGAAHAPPGIPGMASEPNFRVDETRLRGLGGAALHAPIPKARGSKLRTKLRLLLEGGSFGSLHLRGASKVRKKGNDTTMYSWERRRRVV
jgi:hypothetical protein